MYRVLRLYLVNILQYSFVHSQVVYLPKMGCLKGITTNTSWSGSVVYQFLGVPYAESPSQNLRFKPPVPRSKWNGIRDATQFGHPCPSLKLFVRPNAPVIKGDVEDCLNLSVYTKNLEAKQPVMVYIHGGSFTEGSAEKFHPNYLLEKDVVLVVPQYRLGILGFLSAGTVDIPGNVAVLDIKLALEWVQQFISYFGGNPNVVTLFGQSAGASLVSGMMLSPAIPNNLFTRTIVQSGSIVASWSTSTDSVNKAQSICKKLGCTNCSSSEEIHKNLLKAPVDKLLEASTSETDLLPFSLTTGDYHNIFPLEPDLLAQKGTKYSMIIGVTKHEGTFILSTAYDFLKRVSRGRKIPARKFIEMLLWAVKERDSSGIIANMATKLFFKSTNLDIRDYTNLIPGLIDFAGMITIKSPLLRFAQLNAKSNINSNYLYTFDYGGEHTYFGYEAGSDQYPFRGGIHHSDENIYLFATHKLNERDTQMAKTMVDLWTSFAIHGEPKSSSIPKWEPMTTVTGPYLHINEKSCLGREFIDEFLVTINDTSRNMIRKTWVV